MTMTYNDDYSRYMGWYHIYTIYITISAYITSAVKQQVKECHRYVSAHLETVVSWKSLSKFTKFKGSLSTVLECGEAAQYGFFF